MHLATFTGFFFFFFFYLAGLKKYMYTALLINLKNHCDLSNLFASAPLGYCCAVAHSHRLDRGSLAGCSVSLSSRCYDDSQMASGVLSEQFLFLLIEGLLFIQSCNTGRITQATWINHQRNNNVSFPIFSSVLHGKTLRHLLDLLPPSQRMGFSWTRSI